jgi:mannose-1-phosphate guanylyltransferase/mannose-6-phosphate isomerase
MSERSWGRLEPIFSADGYQLRRLLLAPGGRLAPERHLQRSEHWVIVKGMARVTRGPHEFTLHPNESVYIPAGVQHRLENHSAIEALEVVEVQIGRCLGDDEAEGIDGPDRRP